MKTLHMVLIAVFAMSFTAFQSTAFAQPEMNITQYGGYGNIYAYEAGSVRAEMSWYSMHRTFGSPSFFHIRSMTFEKIGTYSGPEVPLTIGDKTFSSSPFKGQIISGEQFVEGNHYTVFLTGGKKGYPVNQGTNLEFSLTTDIPIGYDGQSLGFTLVGYEVVQTNGFRYSWTTTSQPILPFNIAPAGSSGLAPIPQDLSLTVARGGAVSAFLLQSISASQFSIFGYPTWYGVGINSSGSGGMTPGSTFQIQCHANSNVPVGQYVGSYTIAGENRIARTSRATVTVY